MDKKDELLLLTAISGEIPADWIGRAVDSESYAAALLTRLKREGDLKLRSKDGIRGYLLRARAKEYLLEEYGEDVALFLSGAASTNHVKSEPEKRLRLHRMSMVWIFCHRCGIRIFASKKPDLFPALHRTPSGSTGDGSRPASYYGTAEWKQDTDKEIMGSRACGVLVSDRFYIVYNTMDSLMKWVPKTERNLRSRMELRLRRYGYAEWGGAVLMGTSMEMVTRLLQSDGGIKGNLFSLDDVYENYYFVPFLKEASLQLRLLYDREGSEKFYRFLCSALETVNEERFGSEAGVDKNGNRVYFCYLLELWRLKRICEQAVNRSGKVFCFTYQVKVLKAVLPASFTVEAIRPEKVRRYLGWEE